MSKETKKPVTKTIKTSPTGRGPVTFLDSIDKWAAAKDKTIFITLVIACLLLSFLSFNARISEAHDDALYLEGGWRYVNEFPKYFYTQNAPLYPMFLGLLIKIMGFKLIIFKLFSVLFNLFGFVFFYKALRGRIPAAVFLPVAIFQACNSLIIYYASMTFTEAFYFFLQGLFFYYAVKLVDVTRLGKAEFKPHLKIWLMMGLSMFLISTAKSSAIVVIPAVILYFALEGNFKAIGLALGSYAIFKIPYELIVRTVWEAQNQFAGQGRILLQKDPYDKALGDEDAIGFVARFFENLNLSLSKRFYQLLNWKSEENTDVNWTLTVFTLGLIVLGFVLVMRFKNKEMLMLSLFTGAQLALSYIILQTRWDQPRITLVCMPVMLILMFYSLYFLFNRPGLGFLYLIPAMIMSSSVFSQAFTKGMKNLPIVQKNLKGDKYFGYTQDWQNFLKCSEWCSDSLSKESLVASRKAPMSFVYGKGKKFFPVYSVVKKDTASNQSNPDSALAYFKKNNVTHIMLASLRMNPNDPNGGVINTIHNIIYPINEKYPQSLKLVHTEGTFEECQLFELVYPK